MKAMIPHRSLGVAIATAALTVFAHPAAGQTTDAQSLVAPLRQGGLVIVMRHASSPRSVPTAATATPGNAKLERQLDDAGRASAAAMGEALRRLQIPITSVLSSGTFRALQTVRLAGLPEPMVVAELGDNGQSMQATTDAQRAWLKARVAQVPAGGNVLLVTHMPNIQRAFPEWGMLADGEAVVLRPDGKTAAVLGKITIESWPKLQR
jgi:phosphohistidine phosphatase SixA